MGGAYLSIGFVHSFNEGMTERHGLHRPRRARLRQVAPVPDVLRGAAVRLLERARRPAAERVRQPVGHALPGAAVHADADRGRRRDRPLDRAGGRRPAVCQAVSAARPASPSCFGALAVLAIPVAVVLLAVSERASAAARRCTSRVPSPRVLALIALWRLAAGAVRRARAASSTVGRAGPLGPRSSPGRASTPPSPAGSRSASTARSSARGRAESRGATASPRRVRDREQPA